MVTSATSRWDVCVVGSGPAGSAAALGALTADPALRVLLLDRADFPRDKACGDGIAPHVLDVLAEVGVPDPLAGWAPVRRLALRLGAVGAERDMARDAHVVPREVFDARLLEAAVRAGAVPRRHRVRHVVPASGGVEVDGALEAQVLVGADGAHSVVRSAVGLPMGRRRALAIRGYAPAAAELAARQVIVFGEDRQPSYAWSFDRGDGLANVGYGELLRPGEPGPSRRLLLDRLDELLPGAGDGGRQWRAHHLPLSGWRWRQPDGRVLLAGDAASLVNPLTGEGLYYAVATGVLAGRAAAAALAVRDGASAGARHRTAVRRLLGRHLRHTAVTASAARWSPGVRAAVRAAAADQQVFDGLVEVGLGRGLVRPGLAASVAARLG